ALIWLTGCGVLDDLRNLGFEIWPGATLELPRICPNLELDGSTGYFASSLPPPTTLDQSLFTAILALKRTGEAVVSSDRQRCFDRLSSLAVYLLEKGESQRSLQILQLTSQLLVVNAEEASLIANRGVFPEQKYRRSIVPESVCATPPTGLAAVAGPAEAAGFSTVLPVLRVRLFGDLQLFLGGRMIRNSPALKGLVRNLLCFLVLNQGRGLSRETVIEWLWPERDPERALTGFYNLWYRLTGSFPQVNEKSPYFHNDERLLSIDTGWVESDVAEFEFLSRQVFFERGSLEERFAAIDRLEELYQNDVLCGCDLHPRIQAAQLRYRSLFLDVLLQASRLHLAAENHSMALWYARRADEADPGREDVCQVLMACLEASGQRVAAMETYLDCQRYLDEELGVLPSRQTTAIYQELIMDGA
ncbi:MAG: bacterial transcriptional activator domain-containing protein, partial [Actinomycetia bacterium]|nr:bacterial transcriptional activator domain-containing protein [Actinomycetes bacterium]